MTYTKLILIFVNFYEDFLRYWYCVNKRISGEYTETEFFIRAAVIRSHLQLEWDLRKWDLDKFRWICSALDAKYELLDPNYFINCPITYINHLKKCYYLEKNGGIYPIPSFW